MANILICSFCQSNIYQYRWPFLRLSKPPPAFNTTHVINQLRVRYFKPLVYKDKALLRKHQGFIIFRPKSNRSLQARDENNPPKFIVHVSIKTQITRQVLYLQILFQYYPKQSYNYPDASPGFYFCLCLLPQLSFH